jgi:hypothetical protein
MSSMLVTQFCDDFEQTGFFSKPILEKIKQSDFNWTFLEIGSFYETLTEVVSKFKPKQYSQKYSSLLFDLKEFFTESISEMELKLEQRSLLTLVFLKGYVHLDSNAVTDGQVRLDKLWQDIETKLPLMVNDFKPYIGSFYSIIALQLFSMSTEFLTRRNLVGAVISKFYNIEEFDREWWLRLSRSSDCHPFLFSILGSGIESIIAMTKQYSKEIPESESKEQLLDVTWFYSSLLQKMVDDYLRLNYHINLMNDPSSLTQAISTNTLQISPHQISLLKSFIITSIKSQLLLNSHEMNSDIIKTQSDLCLSLVHQVGGDIERRIHQIDLLMITQTYPYDWLLNEMEKETQQNYSLILSQTFEIEIVKTINDILEYLTKEYHKTDKIDLEAFEILICFAAEWLQLFSSSEILFLEGMMVLSAIITICFSHLTRGFYEINHVQKAFLVYLNLIYFIEYTEKKVAVMSRIARSEGIDVGKQDIGNKFRAMIKEWDFDDLLNTTQIKAISTSFESSVIRRTGMSTDMDPKLMGMLDEELVFGYIDAIQNLEDFIVNEVDRDSIESMLKLHESSIYYPPEPQSTIRFNRIGFTCLNKNLPELPFPLIRNIDELAVALSIFPLKVNLPKTFYEKSLLKSINEILGTDIT